MNYLAIALFGTAGVLIFLAFTTTVLRAYVRIRVLHAFGLDDYLMLIALASLQRVPQCIPSAHLHRRSISLQSHASSRPLS
jgi:hypothetical protein